MRQRRKRRGSFDPGRLIAGFCLSAGALALGLSFYNPISRASEPAATVPFIIEELPEVSGSAVHSQLKQATPLEQTSPRLQEESTTASPLPTPALVRQPAPTDALPASRVRSVGGTGSSAPSSSSPNTPTTPPLVAIVSIGEASEALADQVAASLRDAGRDTRQSSLAEAGRPDVLLVVNVGPSAGKQAWYCDPGPSGNTVLADLLLETLPAQEGSDPPSQVLQEQFSCQEVHSGRAQTAAVLLEVPAQTAAADASAAIAGAVDRYLTEHASAIRQSRGKMSLAWPASGPITSHYGPSHPLGIDIGQGTGNVVAAADGRVVFTGGNACCSYGYYVVIESAGGVHTLYAHLNRIYVKTGQAVKQGQALGPVGNTGYSRGIHLHFEVFVNGARVDPMLYLP